MDRKRAKDIKQRAKDLFFQIKNDEEAELAERFFGECEAQGLRFFERLSRDNERLGRLLGVTRRLNQERDLPRLLADIVDAAIDLTGAERGFLIHQPPGEVERFEVARNFDQEDISNPELKISRTVATEVLKSGRPISCSNAMDDPRFDAVPSIKKLSLRSVLCVPFRADETILGVVYLDNRFAAGVFDDSHLRLLEAFAAQAAVAIENAQLHEENRRRAAQVEALNRELAAKVEVQSVRIDHIQRLLVQKHTVLAERSRFGGIIGRSPRMQEMFANLDKIIPTDLPVLITGESGTGKELVARVLHFEGPRRAREFVSENCAAIAPTLLESELFGHVQGSFTGADRDKEGIFELASGGTLFLDEIGDMPLEMQTKLLRVLQEGTVRRVGGDRRIDVDVRVIAATHRDLAQMVEEGTFREDLYFRLNVLSIDLPALRDRPGDVPFLVAHFLEEIAGERGEEIRPIDAEALHCLEIYPWPGNIRELHNEVRRMAAMAEHEIRAEHVNPRILKIIAGLAEGLAGSSEGFPLEMKLAEVEKEEILRTLIRTSNNKTKAAEILGISRFTLNRRMEKLGIEG